MMMMMMMMSSGRITLPKGFRFQPSDEELLSHYLEEKNKDPQSEAIIPEINVCEHEPRDLPALGFTMADSPDMEWYFFSPRVFKHSKSKGKSKGKGKGNSKSTQINRATKEGYWKKQGDDKRITRPYSDKQIGGKRFLTFYLPKKQRTDWVIHEYYLTKANSDEQIGDFVLCRLKHKSGKSDHDQQDDPLCDGAEPNSGSCSMAFDVENQAAKQLGNVLSISVEGQPDSCNSSDSDTVKELLDEPGNLDSLFNQPLPPQLQSPIKLGNVSHTTNVHIDECRKRKYQFGDNDPSRTKKNHISTNNVDELVSNTASNSENHAADAIPKEYSQPGENLGSDSFQSLEPPSVNREPRDFSHHNNFIGWDDLPSLIEGIDSSLEKFSDTDIDGGSSDRNTKVVYGSSKSTKGSLAPLSQALRRFLALGRDPKGLQHICSWGDGTSTGSIADQVLPKGGKPGLFEIWDKHCVDF